MKTNIKRNPSLKISNKFKKVLVLGSGALKIGEAGEFDYSGSQAIKALKEEGIKVVLINPNIATIQTSEGLADKIYFLPVNPFFVEKVIKKEKPDGIFLAFGGQTALNCGIKLFEKGILKKHGVEVLGTQVEAIQKTEDRSLFNKELVGIGIKVPRSHACTNKDQAVKAAKDIGFPLIIRAAFTLGGKGSGFASDFAELDEMLDTAFAFSPQVLVEENLKGWKEVEYEVVRDCNDNCITVCNMENFDPLGIHTGESIVIAPSQTLTNSEYHKLRELAIKVIRHFKIVGECNIQYALDPLSEDYRVIEVNARLSRSSALASKATGYPLAHVAAKLALGYTLPELKNAVTKTTTACFEPALDYIALKIPRWDLNKFRMVSKEITSEMKSVGEIMALGRSFEEVMQKGLRMLQVGMHGFVANEDIQIDIDKIENDIVHPTPKRILVIAEALKRGWTVEKISKISGIDKWFLDKLKNIVDMSKRIGQAKNDISAEEMREAKKSGFSDKQIGFLTNKTELEVRTKRKKFGILPSVKQIDTLAAEYPANTNYLYMTYHGNSNDVVPGKKKKAIVLGSGAYCIGSSVEFDWCCVNAVQTAKKAGYETMMINYNPETVSTDYDICDKLYFDELSFERVLDIYEFENSESKTVEGVVVSTGGQVPNNLALKLDKVGVKIFGTDAKNIDRAEDRNKFSEMCDKLGVDQPKWKELARLEDIFKFAENVGYPVLVRPSYVLSGAAMSVAYDKKALETFLNKAVKISKEAPVVVSKFELGAKEVEIDAVAYNGQVVIYAISEHIENAGVHSGDATIVLPPQKLYIETIRRIKVIAKQIAKELDISGPFNMQFLAKNNRVMVIECNLRASRSFPFSSKVTGYNFIEIATHAMISKTSKHLSKEAKKLLEYRNYKTLDLDHVGVKVPQFSFPRLKGADPVSGVEMASTGEVGCFGEDLYEAFLKAMISVGFELPKKGVLFSVGGLHDKAEILPVAQNFVDMEFEIFATEGTSNFLKENGIKNEKLCKISTKCSPNIIDAMMKRDFDLIINIPKNYSRTIATDGYMIRRKSVDLNIPLITNVQVAKIVSEAIKKYSADDLLIKERGEYF
ncbi:carbamoyl phosphate synthase large subunit [Candidatus Peregrinibacteria bacterium CG_4_10_14_0_2_um_filter_38_24]|nr:MAG: carbamoyl phosphate synthase large subunit [Candidatus Peregrinibacteria bacterium CG_4_10_14_0_2_um_filter_38_24]PJC38807.1 MAG: carbamoyl phosphate synthase large subunit [Candidatus Peregrinibacteria bacterium CG_4_9_14_0_2_um_filter_38_9]